MHFNTWSLVLASCWQVAVAIPQTSSSTLACNNSPSLCSRAFNNVTHLGAHDSPFVSNSSNKYTSAGNQFFDSITQLNAGVRLLSAQIHTADDSSSELRLCHTSCNIYDAGTLVSWLSGISSWLDANPSEVVTILIVNSVNADASRLNTDFTASGITKYGFKFTSSSTTTWPTLQSLISANTRLVTFVASLPSGNAAAPYLLDEFTYVFENPYTILSLNNFTCIPDRPTAVGGSPSAAAQSGRMFLMNHFLDKAQLFGEIPDMDNSTITNSPDTSIVGSLGNHAAACRSTYGRYPTFTLVDWFNVGPAIAAVDDMNGISDATGRTSLPVSNHQHKPGEASPSKEITFAGP
ncbi:hypothetical protein EJ06DRAFT_539054 [Trichodelitschia bisporula]|uniref:PLC-like phosphodiesterase n=1 Tax=Trichodelitschia bisporula TaxID=703511 RepID=A0A6G1HPU4_9PEZI|nr:hypothetical protein EJ06DRAFT_539054 [Trichodelitschia bisporula]